MSSEKKVFGTDGVRGRANHYPMTVEMAVALGRAAGKVFRRHNTRSRVVIGKDTRLSCYMYENALISGLCSMGIDTLMVGPFPTPGVAFITRAYRADAGIVISASHNPFYDNGIKFFSSEGFKFSDAWEKEMEALVERNDFRDCLPKDHEIGRNTKVSDANGRYIEFAKATFPRKHTLRGLKIALDCANGAAYKIAPLIFQELDAEIYTFGCEPNGLNINNGVGALFPQEIQKGVIDHKADVGIALDGDGDRIIMVDEHAQIVDGDTLLAICARDMQKNGILRNSKVVSTVMCNFGFIQAMRSVGVEVIQTAVGDRYVIQGMLENDCNLGGEQSGHTIFLDHNTTGDALVTALQVLRIMIETDSSLSELASFVQKCPQVTLNVYVKEKRPLDQMEHVKKETKAIEELLKDSGRVLVRYSGTENICRVMIEGPNQKQILMYAKRIADQIKKEIGQ